VRRQGGKNRNLAAAFAALVTPAALMACALGLWRLGADMGFFSDFAIATGIFSHWQVWLAIAGVLQLVASSLNHYGRGGQLRGLASLFLWLTHHGSHAETHSPSNS
jgi:hypothetical protein